MLWFVQAHWICDADFNLYYLVTKTNDYRNNTLLYECDLARGTALINLSWTRVVSLTHTSGDFKFALGTIDYVQHCMASLSSDS